MSYNALDNQVTATRPDGSEVQFEHHHNYAPPKSLTDASGNRALFETTEREQISAITDRMGDVTRVAHHDPSGKIASHQNAEGATTTFTYTARVQTFINPSNGESADFTFYDLIRIDHPDGTFETFTHNDRGNPLTHTNREGKTSTFTYNGRGQVLTYTNALGGVITYDYNDDATLDSRQDPETGVTTYGYDAHMRVTRITHPDGSFIQLAYNNNDQVVAVTDERSAVYATAYNANSLPTAWTDPKGAADRYAHDLMDRLTRVTDRRGFNSDLTYDAMNRLATVTDANGLSVEYGYDARGWRNAATVGGRTWRIGYDDEGVPVSRTTPLGRTTTYQTNKMGYITRITDPMGRRTDITRDANQRITSIADPLGRNTTYAYNGWNALDSVTAPVMGTAVYERNDLGQLTTMTDLNGRNWTFDYTTLGRLESRTDPLGNTRSHTYDNRGRPDRTTYADGVALTRAYDNAGNLLRRTYDGLVLNYTYDPALNRLAAADGIGLAYDEEGNIVSTDNLGSAFTAAYDNGGRLSTVTYNPFTVTYTYDPDTGLLTSVTDDLSNTRIDFTHDDDRGLTGVLRSNGVETTYTRDDASRLIRIRHGGLGDLQYTLDAAGQITRVDQTLPLDPADLLAIGADAFTHDAASRISSAGYAHDPRGRRTRDAARTFTWDDAGRLTAIDGVTLIYNGLGDLLGRAENDAGRVFYYNYAVGLQPIMAEREGIAGPWLRYYVYTPGGSLLYMIDPRDDNKVYFYHFDHAGSTLFLTDANGAVTDSYAYTPYGRLLGHNGANDQPFTFVGQWGVRQEGADGDFFQMRARYYDANSGRFLSRDPIWPRVADLKSLNPYTYAFGNPLGYVDIDGKAGLTTAAVFMAVLRVATWFCSEANVGSEKFNAEIYARMKAKQEKEHKKYVKESLEELGEMTEQVRKLREKLEKEIHLREAKLQQGGAPDVPVTPILPNNRGLSTHQGIYNSHVSNREQPGKKPPLGEAYHFQHCSTWKVVDGAPVPQTGDKVERLPGGPGADRIFYPSPVLPGGPGPDHLFDPRAGLRDDLRRDLLLGLSP